MEYLWCNCFSVWRSLFFCGVLLATWLLHLLYYMCLWPVQSINGKNILIEKSVSPVLFLLVTTCDTISTISLCVRVFLNETKVALFFWNKLSRNQLRLPLVLPPLQVSDKPQDDDGAGFLGLGKFIYSKTTPKKIGRTQYQIYFGPWPTVANKESSLKKTVSFSIIVFWPPTSISCWEQIS